MSASRTPSLAQVLDAVIMRRLSDAHTVLPGRVERYDAAKQVVDVQPLLKSRIVLEDGTLADESFPVLVSLPVVFPGAGGFRITFPVKQGDGVVVVFAEASLDRWQKLGGEQATDGRRFHLADGIALVGLHDDTKVWTGASESDLTIGKDGGPQVVMKAAEVHIGGNSDTAVTEPAVLGSTYRQAEDVMLDQVTQTVTQVIAQLGVAATGLTAAAAANAIPIVGGALASPGFAAVVSQLGLIASSLGSIISGIANFKAGGSQHLSQIVKVK